MADEGLGPSDGGRDVTWTFGWRTKVLVRRAACTLAALGPAKTQQPSDVTNNTSRVVESSQRLNARAEPY
eukprot:150205-Pyramimonas_sp.AAC.1